VWPTNSPNGPFGLWIATPTSDVIFFERDTSPLHQIHIILHEASHILCDHHSAPWPATNLTSLLFPDLRAETVLQVLARNLYTHKEEREAELMASLISQHLAGARLPLDTRLDPEARRVIDQLEA